MQNQSTIETKGDSKQKQSRRKRRHWYDHEKIDIVAQYDRGELYAARGHPGFVIDPKSKEKLPRFLIENWKRQFKNFGLIKGQTAKKVFSKPAPVKVEAQPAPALPVQNGTEKEPTVQKLLVKTLIENEQLKSKLIELQKMARRQKYVQGQTSTTVEV